MPHYIKSFFLNYLPKLLMLNTWDEEERNLNNMIRQKLINSSLSSIKSLKTVYDYNKNAIFTKSIDEHENFNTSKGLILIENQSDHTLPKTKKLKNTKYLHLCDARIENLIIQNINYLNEIVEFMKYDYKAKKVKIYVY